MTTTTTMIYMLPLLSLFLGQAGKVDGIQFEIEGDKLLIIT